MREQVLGRGGAKVHLCRILRCEMFKSQILGVHDSDSQSLVSIGSY